DRMRVTAWYDNSVNNPNNPDPAREVRWGDQSWDEMLFAFFDFVIPADLDPDLVTGGRPTQRNNLAPRLRAARQFHPSTRDTGRRVFYSCQFAPFPTIRGYGDGRRGLKTLPCIACIPHLAHL